MTTKDYYLKHPNSDEMSEFSAAPGNLMQIRITHFVHWGKARSDVDSKVVAIDEAREVWRKLVGHGYTREEGDDRVRDLAMKHRQLEIGQEKP